MIYGPLGVLSIVLCIFFSFFDPKKVKKHKREKIINMKRENT